MEINVSNLQILFTGVQTIYQNAFNNYAPQVLYSRLATDTPSTTAKEVYPWLGQNTGFREWLGDRMIQNLSLHRYTIENRPFENTVGLNRDTIEDDAYGAFNPMFGQLGKDAAEFPDVLTFDLLANGGSELCFDGQPFFSDNHPGVSAARKKTTYSNDMGGTSGLTWYLACTKQVLKPLIFQKRKPFEFTSLVSLTDPNVFLKKEYLFGVDTRCNVGFGLWQTMIRSQQPLTPANYAAARAQMLSYFRDNGQPWNLVPDTLFVGPANEGAANTILKADFIGGTDTGSTSNVWKGTADLVMTPRIIG